MIIKYSNYNKPISDTICVGMCFFSPINYKKPLININTIIAEFKKYNIPHYIIELLYPGQQQKIENSYIVHGSTVLFSKENLWNILERTIPDKYQKIIFMDSDVLFSDPDWLNKSYELLLNNHVIQPMETTHKDIYSIYEEVDLDFSNLVPPKNKTCFAKAIKNEAIINLGNHHPGYALGIDRNFFHNIGGFFEYCLTGSGDLAFWSSFIPQYTMDSHHLHQNILNKYIEYKNNVYQYYTYNKKIDYVTNCVAMHLYHGHNQNRQYTNRQKYLPLNCDYYHNSDGVLELRNAIFSSDSSNLINYWITRKEDDE